jgi:hypothetical protein
LQLASSQLELDLRTALWYFHGLFCTYFVVMANEKGKARLPPPMLCTCNYNLGLKGLFIHSLS